MDKPANLNLGLGAIEASLHTKIKLYKKRAKEIESYLSKRPDEWGKFQSEFNAEVNNIFRDIMNFEKINLAKGDGQKVIKLRRLFLNKIRKLFTRGQYSVWTVDKPFGYAGDFKIIDDIYQNNPTSTGYARLFDNYYQMTAICVAVRHRKEDFKRFIIDFVNEKPDENYAVMNLGSGSGRDIKELLTADTLVNRHITFDCYEKEKEAIVFSRALLSKYSNVYFINKNILRFIVAKDINRVVKKKYDLIYSTGFFDYLDNATAIKLMKNLKRLLRPYGRLIISNVRDKYSNPTVHYMEWAGEWVLTYRNDDEFKNLFLNADFKNKDLKTQYEQQGIMQYIIAVNQE